MWFAVKIKIKAKVKVITIKLKFFKNWMQNKIVLLIRVLKI